MQRTRSNIREGDATLILKVGKLTPGTKQTVICARKMGKEYKRADPYRNHTIPKIVQWICENDIEVLNVAGPRETKRPGIQDRSTQFLVDILTFVFIYQRWGIKIWDPIRSKQPTT